MKVDSASGLSYLAGAVRAPRALLILLHGVGGSEAHLGQVATEQDPRILCVRPRGPLALGPESFAWFQVAFEPRGPVIRFDQAEASRHQLARFVASMQKITGLGPDRTVLAGFSQGGIMSAGLGLTQPGLMAGFGLIGGRILPELAPEFADREALKGLRAFVAHGLKDTTLPVSWAERSDALLEELGVRSESRRYLAGHELTRAMAADFRAWLDGLVLT